MNYLKQQGQIILKQGKYLIWKTKNFSTEAQAFRLYQKTNEISAQALGIYEILFSRDKKLWFRITIKIYVYYIS